MRTDESPTRIALQPETELEQSLLSELFTRLNNITEAPEHPDKIGTELVFYTLDIPSYSDLDWELHSRANVGVTDSGKLDPEPGSRALVIIHDPEEASAEDIEVDEEQAEREAKNEVEEAIEEAAERASTDENDDEDDEPQSESDGLVPDAHEDLAAWASDIVWRYDMPDEDVEYDEMQDLAKAISQDTDRDIKANMSKEDLVSEFRSFVGDTDERKSVVQ